MLLARSQIWRCGRDVLKKFAVEKCFGERSCTPQNDRRKSFVDRRTICKNIFMYLVDNIQRQYNLRDKKAGLGLLLWETHASPGEGCNRKLGQYRSRWTYPLLPCANLEQPTSWHRVLPPCNSQYLKERVPHNPTFQQEGPYNKDCSSATGSI